jgi:hypothetical protein
VHGFDGSTAEWDTEKSPYPSESAACSLQLEGYSSHSANSQQPVVCSICPIFSNVKKERIKKTAIDILSSVVVFPPPVKENQSSSVVGRGFAGILDWPSSWVGAA